MESLKGGKIGGEERVSVASKFQPRTMISTFFVTGRQRLRQQMS